MKKLIHLDIYDGRRFNEFEDIECRECAHFGPACGNAVVVLDAMRSTDNDMGIPVFDFTPDGDANASQCPGLWPSEGYLRATAQAAILEREEAESAAEHYRAMGAIRGFESGRF